MILMSVKINTAKKSYLSVQTLENCEVHTNDDFTKITIKRLECKHDDDIFLET